jgi:hypothetical protein
VPMFVLADAFTATARAKIEAAGGTFQSLAPEPRDHETATATARDATSDASATAEGDPTELDGGPADPASRG